MSNSIQLYIKRIFDIVVCILILIIGFPFLLLFGILVKLSSPGPVFFVQTRIGKKEEPYKVIKFRTMSGSPDKNAMRWTKSDEERITRIGHFMRDFGLDELPQLFNILKGDMSIIGPRTPLPQQVEAFPSRLKKMFTMRPGVLSLAAIAGRRSLTMEQRYELHVQYVETWSLKLDLKILWRSLFVVLRREAATEKLPGE
jgi:undecaprenyl phosphate N,N'-diacetylbacillosamine 1-phosphate transferase